MRTRQPRRDAGLTEAEKFVIGGELAVFIHNEIERQLEVKCAPLLAQFEQLMRSYQDLLGVLHRTTRRQDDIIRAFNFPTS